VVGRPAGGVQADDGVDDGARIDGFTQRAVILAQIGDLGGALGGRGDHRIAQIRARIDEGGAGYVQAHNLHQHLIGVRRAVKGAGARAVIAGAFRIEQLGAVHLAFRIELANARLFSVRQAGAHGAGRQKERRQMAKAQRADQLARHDLVTGAKADRGVEHVVGQETAVAMAITSRENSDNSMPGWPWVTPSHMAGHAAGDLADRADLAQRGFDLSG
jgi:hypothetical protein